jgi:uncharacterized protein YhaN
MRILDITVEGFGVFSQLELKNLSETVSVLYGRNEAGKTTLLQFVRTMLYGLTPQRRSRYLPPRGGGRPGGTLRIQTPTGIHIVKRELRTEGLDDGRQLDEGVVVTGNDGRKQGGHALRVLLSGVDELTYRNVYAVGLREMQELGTLSDSDAARHLYDLSAGLDRVSLVDVLRELKRSRTSLLDGSHPDSEVMQLLRRQKELDGELSQIRQSMGRYQNLTSERLRLTRQIAGLEKERAEVEQAARVTELAVSLRDRWESAREIKRRLQELGSVSEITDDDVQRLDELGQHISGRQQVCRKMKAQRQQRREQAAAYPINQGLQRHGSRIEALAEQRNWILWLEKRVEELDGEVAEREAKFEGERRRLNVDIDLAQRTKSERKALIGALTGPARLLRDARRALTEYRRRAAESEETSQVEADQLSSALETRGQQDLPSALDATSRRVDQLRERLELDEKLQRMEQQYADLKEDRDYLVDRQVLPSWGLAASGFAFALGVMMLLAGLLAAIYGTGWPYVLIGLGLIGGVIITKLVFESAAEQDLDSCERQLDALGTRIKKAREDREALDALLPSGGGPLVSQLRAAEQELADLRGLAPLEEKKQASERQHETVSRQAAELEEQHRAARKGWSQALRDADLPSDRSPQQIRELIKGAAQLARYRQRLDDCREQSEQRRRELHECAERLQGLFDDVGLEPISERLMDRVDQLTRAWTEQHQWTEQREEVLKQSHELRRQQLAISRDIIKLQNQRNEMLEEVEAESADEYRRMAKAYAESQKLKEELRQLQSEIRAALSDTCSEKELSGQLDGASAEQLERRWEKLTGRLDNVDQQLKEAYERRGRLSEQLRSLGEDRRAAHKQLELNCVQQQLGNATARWQELAVTSCLLESIRRRYEQERQPATLREASVYLSQLTEERYGRIWTLLDEDALRVDDQDGRSLAPEALSRGTREQLFLALRLALIAQYAQRGVRLPLVLDDVFVNFDSRRARAAADVIRDFAGLGHQVLVFTCHEHILGIFRDTGADWRTLSESGEDEIVVQKLPVRSPRPQKEPAPAPSPPEPEIKAEAMADLPPESEKQEEPTPKPNPQPLVSTKPEVKPEPAEVEPVTPPLSSPEPEPATVSWETTWETDEDELRHAVASGNGRHQPVKDR